MGGNLTYIGKVAALFLLITRVKKRFIPFSLTFEVKRLSSPSFCYNDYRISKRLQSLFTADFQPSKKPKWVF